VFIFLAHIRRVRAALFSIKQRQTLNKVLSLLLSAARTPFMGGATCCLSRNALWQHRVSSLGGRFGLPRAAGISTELVGG